jgi:ABC-type molybdate transport system permease subunit
MSDATMSNWSSRTKLLALLFVLAPWVVGLVMLAGGNSLGWLPTLLAAWLTAGLVYSGWFHPGTMRR